MYSINAKHDLLTAFEEIAHHICSRAFKLQAAW